MLPSEWDGFHRYAKAVIPVLLEKKLLPEQEMKSLADNFLSVLNAIMNALATKIMSTHDTNMFVLVQGELLDSKRGSFCAIFHAASHALLPSSLRRTY